MNDSEKRLSSGSGENNENDTSREHVNSNSKSRNEKKKVGTKHFMSPTISAASKAAAPRKKVLTERIESSSLSDDEYGKSFDVERRRGISRSDRSSSRSFSRAYESDGEGGVNSVNDLSVKPYNPLTNYLSPRPRYLRFDPNKRVEILNRIEREEKDLNSSSDSQEGEDEVESVGEELKEVIEQGSDENVSDEFDDEEDEEEGVEVERGWCLRGVLKVMLTLIACLLWTSYVCSMNSPTPSSTQQAITSLKDGYLVFKKQTFDVISMKVHEAGLFKVEEVDVYDEVEEIEMDEEDENGNTEDIVEEERVVDYKANLDGSKNDDKAEVKAESFEEPMVENTDERDGFCLEKEVEASYDDSNEDNMDKTEANLDGDKNDDDDAELKVESVEENIVAEIEDRVVKEIEVSYDDSNEGDIDKTEAAETVEVGEVENETDISGKLDEKSDDSEEIIGSHEKFTDSSHKVEETGNDIKGEFEKMRWSKNTSAAVGVAAVVSIVLSSLAFIFRSKKTRNTLVKESRPVLRPHKFPVEKKIEFSARPEELNRNVYSLPEKKIEFSARPEEFNHHEGAPTVELIGEIVVGKMSSLRIDERKYDRKDSEERNDTTSFSKQASTPTKTSELEYSTTNSPYGSFTTAEKKISKKEGGRSGEPAIAVTPVRRSTRIRNRAAGMSP